MAAGSDSFGVNGSVFVGRRGALEQMTACSAAVRDGGFRTMVVAGEAGTGKSSLVRHFVASSETSTDSFVAGFGQCRIGARPLLPIRQSLESFLPDGERGEGTSRKVGKRLLRGLKEVAPDVAGILVPGSSVVIASARFLAEDVGWFSKLQDANPDDESGRVAGRFDEQLGRLLRHLAVEAPLVLVIEDCQWVDQASLGALSHLIVNEKPERVLVVLTHRPSLLRKAASDTASFFDELGARGDCVSIDLEELSRVECESFTAEVAAAYPGVDGLAELLSAVTGGNPMFAQEYIRLLVEAGALYRSVDDSWTLDRALATKLRPSSMTSAISRRVEDLDEHLRDVLDHCAVAGTEFDASGVAAAMGVDRVALMKRISRDLDARHQLVEDAAENRELGQARSYRFRHDAYRTALYDAIPLNYRRELHARFATVLKATGDGSATNLAQVADHARQAGDPATAVEVLVEAASSADDLLTAQDFIERALAVLPEVERASSELVAGAHVLAGSIYRARRFWKEARATFDVALGHDSSLSDKQWCEAALGLAIAKIKSKDNSGARVMLFRLLTSPRSSDQPISRLEATRQLAVLQRESRDFDGALALYDEVRRVAWAEGRWLTLAEVENNMGFVHGPFLRDYETAVAHYERASAIALEHGYPAKRLMYLRNMHTYTFVDDFRLARSRTQEACELADAQGNPNDVLRGRLARARVEFADRMYAEAFAELCELEEFADDLSRDPEVLLDIWTVRCGAALLSGDVEAALADGALACDARHERYQHDEQDIGSAAVSYGVALAAGGRDSEQAHHLFVDEVQRLRKRLLDGVAMRWSVEFNLTLACIGAAATADGSPTSLLDEAAVHLDRLPGFRCAHRIAADLVERLDGPNRSAVAEWVEAHGAFRSV